MRQGLRWAPGGCYDPTFVIPDVILEDNVADMPIFVVILRFQLRETLPKSQALLVTRPSSPATSQATAASTPPDPVTIVHTSVLYPGLLSNAVDDSQCASDIPGCTYSSPHSSALSTLLLENIPALRRELR